MRIKTTFLLFLHSVITLAQGSGKDVQVEYQAFFNTSWPMKMFTTLYVSGNSAVYTEKFSTKEPWLEKSTPEILAQQKKFATGMVLEDFYLKIDSNKKEVLFYDYVMSERFLVRDTYPDIKWMITDEVKTVAGLECIKATADFRGRQWIAWFAPGIASPFGPWKLQGLPGIILEAYDSTEVYAMKAVKIEFKKSEFADKDFTRFIPIKNTKPISYRKFIEDNQEGMDNLLAGRDLQKDANEAGIKVTNISVGDVETPRTGMELVYEWEQ